MFCRERSLGSLGRSLKSESSTPGREKKVTVSVCRLLKSELFVNFYHDFQVNITQICGFFFPMKDFRWFLQ